MSSHSLVTLLHNQLPIASRMPDKTKAIKKNHRKFASKGYSEIDNESSEEEGVIDTSTKKNLSNFPKAEDFLEGSGVESVSYEENHNLLRAFGQAMN